VVCVHVGVSAKRRWARTFGAAGGVDACGSQMAPQDRVLPLEAASVFPPGPARQDEGDTSVRHWNAFPYCALCLVGQSRCRGLPTIGKTIPGDSDEMHLQMPAPCSPCGDCSEWPAPRRKRRLCSAWRLRASSLPRWWRANKASSRSGGSTSICRSMPPGATVPGLQSRRCSSTTWKRCEPLARHGQGRVACWA